MFTELQAAKSGRLQGMELDTGEFAEYGTTALERSNETESRHTPGGIDADYEFDWSIAGTSAGPHVHSSTYSLLGAITTFVAWFRDSERLLRQRCWQAVLTTGATISWIGTLLLCSIGQLFKTLVAVPRNAYSQLVGVLSTLVSVYLCMYHLVVQLGSMARHFMTFQRRKAVFCAVSCLVLSAYLQRTSRMDIKELLWQASQFCTDFSSLCFVILAGILVVFYFRHYFVIDFIVMCAHLVSGVGVVKWREYLSVKNVLGAVLFTCLVLELWTRHSRSFIAVNGKSFVHILQTTHACLILTAMAYGVVVAIQSILRCRRSRTFQKIWRKFCSYA